MRSAHRELVERVVHDVMCEPFVFVVSEDDCAVYVQASLWRADTHTGEEGWGYGAKYPIPVFDEDQEDEQRDYVVKRCLVAALSYAEHEVREAFLYQDKRIFGPHIPIAYLLEIAGD